MGVNSLPKTVTRQRRGCDLNPGPTATESSTLTTRLPSHFIEHDKSLIFAVCLFPVAYANDTKYVQIMLGVTVRFTCPSGALVTSFKDVID